MGKGSVASVNKRSRGRPKGSKNKSGVSGGSISFKDGELSVGKKIFAVFMNNDGGKAEVYFNHEGCVKSSKAFEAGHPNKNYSGVLRDCSADEGGFSWVLGD